MMEHNEYLCSTFFVSMSLALHFDNNVDATNEGFENKQSLDISINE